MGPALMENRDGLVVDACLTRADGHAERIAALHMIEPRAERPERITLGADKGYDVEHFVNELRSLNIAPHVAAKVKGSAIDGRTTRHAGYKLSQVIRKRIEEVFGWPSPPPACASPDTEGSAASDGSSPSPWPPTPDPTAKAPGAGLMIAKPGPQSVSHAPRRTAQRPTAGQNVPQIPGSAGTACADHPAFPQPARWSLTEDRSRTARLSIAMRDDNLHRLISLDEGRGHAPGLFHDLDLRKPRQEFFPEYAQLQFGQAVADAAVDAEAEGQVLAGPLAVDDVGVRVLDHLIVPVAGRVPHDDLVALPDRLAA